MCDFYDPAARVRRFFEGFQYGKCGLGIREAVAVPTGAAGRADTAKPRLSPVKDSFYDEAGQTRPNPTWRIFTFL